MKKESVISKDILLFFLIIGLRKKVLPVHINIGNLFLDPCNHDKLRENLIKFAKVDSPKVR